MTLVVCWRTTDVMSCVADTRVSLAAETLTDAGAKLFLVPITTHLVADGKESSPSHHTLCFAFAGSTLIANNTHAIASSCTQLLNSPAPNGMPSLDAIARIYGKVADYVTRDLNSRRAPSERSTIHGFIFGYCPRSCRFKLAILAPEQTPTSFEMQVDVHELAEGSAFAIGSGSTLFRSMMKSAQGAVSPLDIFREITEGAKLPDVGGAPQIAYADRRGANIQPIISQSDTNPDQVKLTIFGFDLREIGDIEGFSVGFRATGVGAEKVQLRAALRHKAIDPDAPNISQDVKNSAAIEAALRALAAAKPKLNTPNRLINNENLTVAAILPVENDWYYVTNCANCGVNTPICEDPSQGKLGNVFVGQGVVRVSCWLCGKAVHASSDQITNTQWKYP